MDTKGLIQAELQSISTLLTRRQQYLCTAESCTGGLISAYCTHPPGSSQWFERGFITYSNLAKQEQLGVNAQLIHQHGAVSEPVACAMAQGALQHSQAHWSIAVTGIAGPSGGTLEKPVGLVWFGFAQRTSLTTPATQNHIRSESQCFSGDRENIRLAAVTYALNRLHHYLSSSS